MWPFKKIPVVDPTVLAQLDELANRLALLGSTPRQIAQTLYDLDIIGIRYEKAYCPVANYLRRQYNTTHVCVYQDSVVVNHLKLPIPGVIAEFIRQFDEDVYEDLRMKKRELTKTQTSVPAPAHDTDRVS